MSAFPSPPSAPSAPGGNTSSKRTETLTFLLLAFVLLPALSVGVVGVYGFSFWFLQMIYGPPGL